jgi:hypothetical protein
MICRCGIAKLLLSRHGGSRCRGYNSPIETVFLLSPAYCGGRRATYLLRPDSSLTYAARLVAGTLTLGEAFSFMSGLYFRGKLAYAMQFGQVGQVGRVGDFTHSAIRRREPERMTSPIHIITPTRGLMPPDALISADLLREFAGVDVKTDDQRYRRPLDRDLEVLRRRLSPTARVVLLGSIATGKYVDALTAKFGERLHFPIDFVGRGDMSRGGLMLRSVASGIELPYSPLMPHVSRHGSRPPKLAPLR